MQRFIVTMLVGLLGHVTASEKTMLTIISDAFKNPSNEIRIFVLTIPNDPIPTQYAGMVDEGPHYLIANNLYPIKSETTYTGQRDLFTFQEVTKPQTEGITLSGPLYCLALETQYMDGMHNRTASILIPFNRDGMVIQHKDTFQNIYFSDHQLNQHFQDLLLQYHPELMKPMIENLPNKTVEENRSR